MMKNEYLKCLKFFIVIFLLSFQKVNGSNVEIIENLSGYVSGDVWLVDETGETVNLLDEISLPTILAFVYYNCPGKCPSLMHEIKSLIEKSELVPGKDYQVVTISIDPEESHDLAIDTKNSLINEMADVEDVKKWWKFYTGDSINIKKAAESTGFYYQKKGDGFVHKTAMIIINSEGKIIRYNHGIHLLPLELSISIVEANRGNSLPSLFKKDEYCYPYIASAYVKLNKLARISGLIIVFIVGGIFLALIFKPIPVKH